MVLTNPFHGLLYDLHTHINSHFLILFTTSSFMPQRSLPHSYLSKSYNTYFSKLSSQLLGDIIQKNYQNILKQHNCTRSRTVEALQPFPFQNLEQWSIRMSWLDLQLMFKQFPSGSSELSAWLDTVARAVINVFQQPAPPPPDKDR